MLLKKSELDAIKSGRVSLVFRRWRRPTVKSGGTLNTAVGQLGIDRVTEVDASDITEIDANKAGHASKAALLTTLASRVGSVYRIEIRFAGPDPRIALRETDDLNDADFEAVRSRLARFDSSSPVGAWTTKVLESIARHPRLAARELANGTEFEKDWLKSNIRKLKNLGLTISHHPGYELSPRGKAVLERLPNAER